MICTLGSKIRQESAMYTLYYSPGAASFCVHMALIEAAADYTLQRVDLDAGQQRDPVYLALNPNGVVRTLLIDGVAHTEAAALLMCSPLHAQEANRMGPLCAASPSW